jgi:hypothetical protein
MRSATASQYTAAGFPFSPHLEPGAAELSALLTHYESSSGMFAFSKIRSKQEY